MNYAQKKNKRLCLLHEKLSWLEIKPTNLILAAEPAADH